MNRHISLCITAFLAVDIQPSIGIVLTRKKDNTHVPIKCSFNSDISFKFTNKHSNKTQTIAACSTNINSCYLSDKILAQSYAIAKSPVGGVLFIIDVVENTLGTYTCYETYNASNYATLEVHSKDIQLSSKSSTDHVISVSVSSLLANVGLVIDGFQTVLLICCLVGIVFIGKYCNQEQLFRQGPLKYRQVSSDPPIHESNNEATESATSETELVEVGELQSARTIKGPSYSVKSSEAHSKNALLSRSV